MIGILLGNVTATGLNTLLDRPTRLPYFGDTTYGQYVAITTIIIAISYIAAMILESWLFHKASSKITV